MDSSTCEKFLRFIQDDCNKNKGEAQVQCFFWWVDRSTHYENYYACGVTAVFYQDAVAKAAGTVSWSQNYQAWWNYVPSWIPFTDDGYWVWKIVPPDPY